MIMHQTLKGLGIIGLSTLAVLASIALYSSFQAHDEAIHFAAQGANPDEGGVVCSAEDFDNSDQLIFNTQGLCPSIIPYPVKMEQDSYVSPGTSVCNARFGSCLCEIKGYDDFDRDGKCNVSRSDGKCLEGTYECGYHRPFQKQGDNTKVSLILQPDCNDADPNVGISTAVPKEYTDENGDTAFWKCNLGKWSKIPDADNFGDAYKKNINKCEPYHVELDFDGDGKVYRRTDATIVRDIVSNAQGTDKKKALYGRITNPAVTVTYCNNKVSHGNCANLDFNRDNLIDVKEANKLNYYKKTNTCEYRGAQIDTDCDGIADAACDENVRRGINYNGNNVGGGTTSSTSKSSGTTTTNPSYTTPGTSTNVRTYVPPTNNRGTVILPSTPTSTTTPVVGFPTTTNTNTNNYVTYPTNTTTTYPTYTYPTTTNTAYPTNTNSYNTYPSSTNTYTSPSNNVWLQYMQSSKTKNARGY